MRGGIGYGHGGDASQGCQAWGLTEVVRDFGLWLGLGPSWEARTNVRLLFAVQSRALCRYVIMFIVGKGESWLEHCFCYS